MITIPVLTNDKGGPSYFIDKTYELSDYNGFLITDRINAQNFRHRRSEPGYHSSWHLAGDPTLLIIRQGTLRINLRDGSYRDFSKGDQFIAQDCSHNRETLTPSQGHQAELIGNTPLLAVHIKLAERL